MRSTTEVLVMITIVYHKFSKTPINIGNELEDRKIPHCILHSNEEYPKDPTNKDLLINWGVSVEKINNREYGKTLNLAIVPSKFEALDCVGDSCELEAPIVLRDLYGNGEVTNLIGRKYNHFGGKDIKHYGQDGYNDSDFYVQKINKIAEFRLHILGGETKYITYKKPKEGVNPDEHFAWNFKNGFAQHTLKNAFMRKALTNWGKKLFNLFHLDFFCADVIMDEYGRLYFLEINVCPALSARLNLYVDYFEQEWRKLQ
jgi:hypothetical protein